MTIHKGLRPGFPSGLQVLVVDGEELQGQLKELNYSATLFATAREAAAFLSQGQPSVDIILAETRSVHVGDADSQWLLSQAQSRGLPLVLMSSSSSNGEVMKSIELGAVDYLEKPISPLKLRNIWQHVVRKLMAGSTGEERPSCFAKVAPAVEKVSSASDTQFAPSPAASADHVHSGLTAHSSKCSEADASSCSETTKCGRVLRSADTSAESSGKGSATMEGAAETAAKSSTLSRAQSSGTVSRPRSRRAARDSSKRMPAAAQAASGQTTATAASVPAAMPAATIAPVSFTMPAPLVMPPGGWQAPAGCVWGTPLVPSPMGWQQFGLPASFMPVTSAPPSGAITDADASSGTSETGKAASASPSPASLLSVGSFASAMSCSMELDLPFPSSADIAVPTSASPSFGGSDDSLHSDFTDLMLPDDLDLDLMFGDGADALLVGDSCFGSLPLSDKPPIGLSLRKSESFVNLINERLKEEAAAHSAAPSPAADLTAAAVPAPCS